MRSVGPRSFTFSLIGLLLPVSSAAAQNAQPSEHPTSSFAFDVASIKPSEPGSRGLGAGFSATGYRAINVSLTQLVYLAYLTPFQGSQLIGMPGWADKEHYDIVARIDEASAPAWLKLDIRQQQQAGRPMLQKLLAERCKLVVHTVPTLVDGYVLVVGKRGSHVKVAQPRETYPAGVKDSDPGGGKVLAPTSSNNNTMSFYSALISDLAAHVGITSNSIIVDRTNLTGRYDFTIRRLEPRDSDGKPVPNPLPSDFWDISATGLELQRAKVPSQNLVIDHIEKPSEN